MKYNLTSSRISGITTGTVRVPGFRGKNTTMLVLWPRNYMTSTLAYVKKHIMESEGDLSESSDILLDQNENRLIGDPENSFVGVGEARNVLCSTAKKLKRQCNNMDNESLPEMEYLRKLVHSLALDKCAPLKVSDFTDRESIVNALNVVLSSLNHNEDLAEWIESSHFVEFAESFQDFTTKSPSHCVTNSPRDSLGSSLGILSYSDLSSFSSNEAIKESLEFAEPEDNASNAPDFLSEIQDLQYQVKRLNKEKIHMTQQMSQTEEMNTNLYFKNQEMQRNRQCMQDLLERLKETEKEYERLKITLGNYEEANHTLQEKLTAQHRERLSLEVRIRALNEELTIVNQEIESLRSEVEVLNESLTASKVEVVSLKNANEIMNHDLQDKCEELLEKATQLTELEKSTEYLKTQKVELEVQLCRAEEEIASLQHASQRFQIIIEEDEHIPFSCSCNSDVLNASNCANCTQITSKHVGETLPNEDATLSPIQNHAHMSSTPSKTALVRKATLCDEMRDVVFSNGTSLPTPFCGKHILPAALYNHKTDIPYFDNVDETDSPISSVPKLNVAEILNSSSSNIFNDLSIRHLSFDSADGLSKVAAAIETGIQDHHSFLTKIYRTLLDINSSLESINAAENTPALTAYPDTRVNGVIHEPPPPSSNVSGADDTLKDQISVELKVLRSQIAKTQAILSFLSRGQKLPIGISSLNSFIIEKDVKRGIKSELSASFHRLSADLLSGSDTGPKKSFWSREHIRQPSNSPSQKSTPLHRSRYLTKSCPNLPSQWSVINRATQTETDRVTMEEPMKSPRTPVSESVRDETTLHDTTINENVVRTSTSRDEDLSITVSPLALRNRSLSYVTAIKKGNWDDCQLAPANEDVVIVHDKTPDIKTSPLPEDSNKNHKDVLTTADDEVDSFLVHDNCKFQAPEPEFGFCPTSSAVECEVVKTVSEPGACSQSSQPDKAKKRRRSFSEHNSNYSGTIDLDETATDYHPLEKMQGPFVPSATGTPPDSLAMDKIAVTLPVSLSPPSVDVSAVKFPKASAAFNARVALSDKSKRIGRNRFLMPDVMETSETESAKDSANGSMESETTELPTTTTTTVLTTATTSVTLTTVAPAITTDGPLVDVVLPPPPSSEPSFPSLTDDFLKKLNLEKGSAVNTEELTSQEVESKFGTLSLAFKTDKFTLSKRLELQKRQRDMAENNIENEVSAMRDALNALNHMCNDSQMRELIVKVQHHIDIVHQSTARMSSRAEVYGAVQQEERMSHAYEIMVTYVENLKRLYQKEHHELEDTRRVLIENRLLPENNPTGNGSGVSGDVFGSSSDDPKRPTRTSIASGSYKPQQQQQQSSRRRASVAVFHRPILEAAKSCIGTLSNFGVSASNGEFRARLYSAVTPLSLSPAKLERLNAVAVTSGSTVPSTPSPPITPAMLASSNNQRFPSPGTTPVQASRKLAIGSSATGPLNSMTGNEELLAALNRVDAVEEEKKTNTTSSQSDATTNENNNNEIENNERKGTQNSAESFERQQRYPLTKNNSKDERRTTPESDKNAAASAFNPYPYARQLSRIFLQRDFIRPNTSWLPSVVPDNSWWSRLDFKSVLRNIRFTLGAVCFLGALISIVVTFFPIETSACNNSGSYTSGSIQEFFEGMFRHYVTLKNEQPPV